ncbi:MAG: ABC transporter ATP-binding protein, partial [Pseudomonadota bacterium]|nr:ABC transporter ATP-binding protein [Pseudomonadota bacterium]
LILDEATSALDPEAEAAISHTLKALTPGLTIVAVSHRPALVDIADQVYRLREGRLTPVEATDSGMAYPGT